MSGDGKALFWTRRVVVAFTAGWVLTLAWAFAVRIGFALELEWMEGGVLHQAARFASGQPLYPPPSIDFVPFLYTPGYPIVVGTLGWLLGGPSFVLGRAVSILATVATGWAIAAAIRGEGKPREYAWAGAGLFAAGYVFTFRWYDLARPDSLYIALVLWALVHLRRSASRRRAALVGGLLMALAFWTKQTAASFVVASGIGALLVAPRALPWYAGVIAIVDGGGMLWGNAATDGWLWTYVFELHQTHAFNDERFSTKTWGMFAHAAPPLVLWGAIATGRSLDRLRRRRWPEPGAWRGPVYWWLMAAAGLLVSAVGYSTAWAEPNAFIPGVALGAVAIMVSIPTVGRFGAVGLGLVAVQLAFAWLVEPMYQPIQDDGPRAWAKSYAWQRTSRTIPSREHRDRAARLRDDLTRSEGEVLALHRPWWSNLAGGEGHVGSMGVRDVSPEDQKRLQAELRASIRAGRWSSIWLEGDPPAWLSAQLRGSYRVERRLSGDARVRPMSGWMSEAGVVTPYERDQVMLVPKGPRPRPADAIVIEDFESRRAAGFTFEGAAFGLGPVSPPTGRLPWPGPFGGSYLLSSAGRRGDVRSTGVAISGTVSVRAGDRLEMLAGVTRASSRLRLLVIAEDDRRVELPLPTSTPHVLSPLSWTVPSTWDGAQIRLRLEDEAPEAALYVDDLWQVRL
jgi:hypothetical protein